MTEQLRHVDKDVEEVIERERAETDGTQTAHGHQERLRRDSARQGLHIPFAARLVLAFIMTAAMTAIIAACILGYIWNSQFEKYTNESVNRLAEATATKLADSYIEQGGFTEDGLSGSAPPHIVYPALGMQIHDAEGTVIYDDLDMMTSVSDEPGDDEDKELVVSKGITVEGRQVGTLSFWAYPSDRALSQADIAYRDSTSRAIIYAAFIAAAFAALVGYASSRWMLEPVHHIAETVRKLKSGDMSARTNMSGDDELSQLGASFDSMADSIEMDRERERRLTADVAHELRTPLMGIQATVEAIIDGVFPADEERLASIDSETRRLKRLVDALLNLSRYESGAIPFKEQRIDLTELIRGLFMNHEALLDEAGITHAFVTDGEPVIVDGDADMIRQATANLISNAVRYNREHGGRIVVEVRAVENMGVISVSDNGIGIAPEDCEKVFTRFWRADAGRERASGGLGVGLAVVQQIAAYHSGHVEVASVLGEGTTFSLYIPLHCEEPYKPTKGIANMIHLSPGRAIVRTKGQERADEASSRQRMDREERAAKQKAAREQRAARQKAARQKAAREKIVKQNKDGRW